MTVHEPIPIARGLQAIVAVASDIGRTLPAAGPSERRSWKTLAPELAHVHRLVGEVSEEVGRGLLLETLEVLLRFRADLPASIEPS